MKTIKKMTLVLTALFAVFAFAGCSDDEKEEETLDIIFKKDSVQGYDVEGTTTTGVFISDKVDIDGEDFQFFLYVAEKELNSTIGAGAWIFGFYFSDEQLVGVYKGTFTEIGENVRLNRTHILNANGGWTASVKNGWKTINTSSDTFTFTLTEEDGKELESIFGDN